MAEFKSGCNNILMLIIKVDLGCVGMIITNTSSCFVNKLLHFVNIFLR